MNNALPSVFTNIDAYVAMLKEIESNLTLTLNTEEQPLSPKLRTKTINTLKTVKKRIAKYSKQPTKR